MKKLLLIMLLGLGSVLTVSAQEARLLRFPAIYGNQIVFSYAGDLYSVTAEGGLARKITTDAMGYEMFPRFSPDGKQLAFTAQYDGNTEVYLIPSEGGLPKRLTYTATLNRDDISDRMGPNNIVMCWKNKNQIVYRSRKQSFNDFKGQLFTVDSQGGMSQELPLPDGGFCSFSADGNKMAYNRVFREFRTWKYYQGGMADDIWIHDFKTHKTENITNNVHQDIFPMWYGDVVYFLSDRDRIMNLFSYDIKTKETKKLTDFKDYDIKFPSLGNESIVFEQGGYIWNYKFSEAKAVKVNIRITEDFTSSRSTWKDASKSINSYDLSPDGKRVVFGARGDIWSVPSKTGITTNLSETSGVHERNVGWSPDGLWIAFVSDLNGEDEIYIQKSDGSEVAQRITNQADTYKYDIQWSPDSKKILWSDKLQRLLYVDISTKKIVEVEKTLQGELRSFAWSPDSKWIAYSFPVKSGSDRIMIYNLLSTEKKFVTDEWYQASDPSFSDDGKYLFFTSSREFKPIYSWTEWNHAYNDMLKVCFIPLQKSTPSPFAPKNDVVSVSLGEKNDTAKPAVEKSTDKDVKIDFDGIEERSIALPVEGAAYWNIKVIGKSVYYVRSATKDDKPSLRLFDLETKKESTLGDYSSYVISSDSKKMMLSSGGKYAVIDLPKSKAGMDEPVDLSGMKVFVDLKAEWLQILNESWRQMRDFFYDPAMHGVDWKAIHNKYNPLVGYVNNRNDLNYVIGEMIGELTTGHSYVGGGDKAKPERIKMGMLGAKISKYSSGYFRIDEILKGENWNPSLRSPLTEAGVDVAKGDFIVSINGKSTINLNDIYSVLVNQAGKQIEIGVSAKADGSNVRKSLVIPIDDEAGLYYYTWVQGNIEKVSKATDGEVGYIHIPDMMAEGLNEFIKYYYPQLNKKALIIDDRGNGGGNVSPMIIERLRRELATYSVQRNGPVTTRPGSMMLGPKVILLDRYSASDGDLFPYQFKQHKIGKAIGMRSWGGVVGIRGSLPLIDGGILNKPEFAPFDTEAKEFVIEGHGVDPDIIIDNDPAKEYAGEDEQLNKAIEVIKEELKTWPVQWPPVPPYPIKNK
ncbi:MAG: PDZ domain-containing protein [Bacteroidales bacterium]|nr:PDZ domain-containing protein [Bacteroidales bacterium]